MLQPMQELKSSLKIKIQNFKGVKHFEGDVTNAILSGKNESGKTSILSAIAWVLCDHDIYGDTNIKPQQNGKDQDVTIRVDLDFNGLKLSKEQREDWQQNKLTLEKVFKGNKRKCFVNDEEVLKKEFTTHVEQFQHKLLNLKDSVLSLCNPGYFPAILAEKSREAVVYSYIPDVTIKDVAEALNKAHMAEWYAGLKDVEKERKKLVKLANELDKEAKEIGAKIAENKRNLPATKADTETLQQRKAELEKAIADINRVISSGTAETRRAEVQAELNNASAEYAARKAQFEANEQKRVTDESNRLNAERQNIIAQNQQIERENDLKLSGYDRAKALYENDLKSFGREVANLERQIEAQRQLFLKEKSREVEAVFCPEINAPCTLAVETFNEEKSKRLGEINQRGKELAEDLETLKAHKFEEPVMPAFKQLLAVPEEITVEAKQFNETFNEQPFIDRLQAIEDDDFAHERAELETKKQVLEQVNSELFEAKQVLKIEQRIEELEEERTIKLKDYTDKQEHIAFIQDFAIQKANLLEPEAERVFGVPVKLFDFQINQTPKPCCRFMVGDTDFEHTNEASRLRCGIAICQRLQALQGLSLPLLIENLKCLDSRHKLKTIIDDNQVFVAEFAEVPKHCEMQIQRYA